MNIELYNPEATRLAFRLAQSGEDHLKWVYLSSDGTLFASDGFAMVMSKQSHEIERDLYVRMTKYTRLSTSGASYTIDTDADTLTEHRPRSQETYGIELTEYVPFPNVYRRIPHRLTSWPKEIPPFDSIRAGKIAGDYGLERGIWYGGPGTDAVHLSDVGPNDLVILAAVDTQRGSQSP